MASTDPLKVASRNGHPPAFVAPILGLAAFERWIESDLRFKA